MQTSTTWNDLLYPGNATDFFTRQVFPLFDPDAKGYNRDNARWLAELSRLVYRHDSEENDPPPQPTRSSFLAAAKFKQIKFFESKKTDTQAMLVESTTQPHYAVLAFRGTEQNTSDLKTDIKIWKGFPAAIKSATCHQNPNEIFIHDGFREDLDSPTQNQATVWDEIQTELLKLTCPVFYTGHSLGAALATLAAARHEPKAAYTFGSPRVGNLAFAKTLTNVPIYRVVDDKDLVTTIPPERIWFKRTGFVHVGEEHQLRDNQANLILGWLKNFGDPPKCLTDHAPINYVDRI